ncbi:MULTISPECIES: aminotransferase class I/II-fold pyridoxal phosphate-dependent enzyme [unclassified Pseudomonas]|uniref:aminotransferase class I/II-fold pyridoxal phosphate-dependent enzyme n=1 Tax=unclassified Pseudomonas TaxID=196821 RepID=UPI000BA2FE6B|nr:MULTISPECIES: aminotransferase class I/II-fold pyridoxal phosphate-dependent enzyme [unclassified Pseudomonas]MCU1732115.1 aminotransferase class I/II-fold pyridoxal phosphate-dependent enzyme [Pseudomonas sp. 20P_3.2_Bac4]MCU1744784.1 aminotransferase class I/II-fold pyridoxal phosphate-dependent enzyme [Pseudomonas sp. 20P_3.2_Bac5]
MNQYGKHNTGKGDTWMGLRHQRTSDALGTAAAGGLTGFDVVARKGKELTLADGSTCTEFVSCSYLGLESHPALVLAAREALERIGIHLSASRGAMSPVYLRQLEQLLSEIYDGASVTVFTSTSNAHLGVLPLLGSGVMEGYPVRDKGVMWLVDRTAHASMQVLRGVLEQFGPVCRVDTADIDAVEEVLRGCDQQGVTPVLLIDGVGSMSGLLPVARLSERLRTHGGYLYVDDAHGISITGRHGAGYAFENLGHRLPANTLIAGSLSKAFGGAGGFIVLRPGYDARQLQALANPLVFGHSIAVPMLAANVAAAQIHLSSDIHALQQRLWRNVRRLDESVAQPMMNADLCAPIRGALFASERQGVTAARALRAAGLVMFPVFYPIVESGKAMLRCAVSAAHTPAQIDTLALQLNQHLNAQAVEE